MADRIVIAAAARERIPGGKHAEHTVTGSRAAIRTRRLTIEAEAPPVGVDGRRPPKRQPIDVELPAGTPLTLTLDVPLVVLIPSTGPATLQ